MTKSRDWFFKVVEMLQTNWALIDVTDAGATVRFIHDASGIFDWMEFASVAEAEAALRRNEFARFSEDENAQGFLYPPEPPFRELETPSRTYSSGRYWQ